MSSEAVGAVLAIGLACVIAIVQSWRHRSVLTEVRRVLTALEEGRPVRPVLQRRHGEIGRLIEATNGIATSLEGRIARLESDGQLLRTVLGGMEEAVLAVDARRRLLFANPTAENLFGLDPAAVGRRVAELVRSPQVHEAVDRTLDGRDRYAAELTMPGPEGWPSGYGLVLSMLGTPLPGDPAPGAVLVFHDVTETRRLERVRQDFVANASHELKTPLASIRAYTETLLDWALDDPEVNTKFLRRIEEQTDRLNRLVQDLLSLARLDSGQEAFQHGPLALRAPVEKAVESYRARAETKGLTFTLEVEAAAADAVVVADEEAIRQILDNLVDNAIKYTPSAGSIRVAIRAPAMGQVSLQVADTGIGIPRADLPRVFERFYRVDKARSRELGGTGLGLSIVKNLAQSLGGQVQVQSALGRGSTFTVLLPRRPSTESGEADVR